ncbi:MAG TPA: PIG-L family deacetylase [Saprospiraceae bacterium]|nr:PIG-L family deacetylase [Saprospiraceae bacterium]
MRCYLILAFAFLFFHEGSSQKTRSSGEIREGLQKLKVLGTVLYIAAHPDDENTRLITFLSKGMHLRTGYLSLTRGDGGQNLIGAELDEYLGAIRTQELLEARKIDGGIQFFTRANDFGYSKNAEETFTIWTRDSVLADVIRAIREFKPDVIINRFDHRSSGRTHGHHTASAILGLEAAQHANSPLFMKEALSGTEPHIVSRVFFNTSWFFFGGKEKFDAMDKSHLFQLETGNYYPHSGLSNNEISAQSRSMHKSQGFGINTSRGSMLEYFERVDQAKEKEHTDPFAGLNLAWSRINGGGNVERIIDQVIADYREDEPWKSIKGLQLVEDAIESLPESHWKHIKLEEVRHLLLDCAGFFAECTTDKHIATPGSRLDLVTECIVRNPVEAALESISIHPCGTDTLFQTKLQTNIGRFWNVRVQIPENQALTSPFWLWKGRQDSFYPVDSVHYYCKAESPRTLAAKIGIRINQKSYMVERSILYKIDDPVLGEVKQPLDILPGITVSFEEELLLAPSGKTKVRVRLQAHTDGQTGRISFAKDGRYELQPAYQEYRLEQAGDHQVLEFNYQQIQASGAAQVLPVLNNGQPAYHLKSIRYPHIHWQEVLVPAQARILSWTPVKHKKRIAYVEGAGDYIDEACRKMGFSVTPIRAEEVLQIDKKEFDVIVFGIRAYNTQQALKNARPQLEKFMKSGGKVIVQYNTTADLITDEFAPAALKITRDRVTNERSPVSILLPDHPAMNKPYKINASDFDHWVQERGLYFPGQYDSGYRELISMNDPGEKELKSGILIRQEDRGWYVYSSLSWFRQLKAGVPGAYRLFANLISF